MALLMKLILACFVLLFSQQSLAAIKVAVASNFKSTLSAIATKYENETGLKVIISSASTGILYNQIKYGAPFDLFLSADSERAELIEQSKQGIAGSRFTYAEGRLVFWYPLSSDVKQNTLASYKGRLAIANPKLAPYGLAAKQTLTKLGVWKKISYIKGANVAQTYQFIDTGNIKAGLVAYSLILQNSAENYHLIDNQLHQPILQQGVLLSNSKHKQLTEKFMAYLQSSQIKQFIRSQGYL